MYWSFLEDLLPNETYYVENIKYTNFILGKNTKSTNLRIHELIIFNHTTKIDAHEEKYFDSIWNKVTGVQKNGHICIYLCKWSAMCIYWR